jgi:hypothetical protein
MGSIEKEPKSGKGREAREERERTFIRGQGLSIQNTLTQLGLPIEVQPGTEQRDASHYKSQMTFGYVYDHSEDLLTAFASSGTKNPPVSTVYIAPTPDHSGLLREETTNQLYTDSFWATEKKQAEEKPVIKHILPTQPIPLDGIFANPEDPVGEHVAEMSREIFELTNNKHETKQVLAAEGINVPQGICIAPTMTRGEVERSYTNFISNIPPESEIVFKPNTGYSHGNRVVLGDGYSPPFTREVNHHIRALSREGNSFLFEERIVPPPSQPLAQKINDHLDKIDPDGTQYARLQPTDVDYNFRVITTLERNPEVIDAEIRYQQKSNTPVNSAKGAGVVRTDSLQDPELVESVYDTARKAVSAVYQHLSESGNPESLAEFIGVDLIPDRERNVYVMEVQWGPGGFGSLARIDENPIQGIKDVLMPAQAEALQDQFSKRQPERERNLQRLPEDKTTEIIRYRSYILGADYINAQKVAYTLATTYNYWSPIDALAEFTELLDPTGNNPYALQYVNDLLATDPDNPRYQEFKTTLNELEK